MAKRSNINVSVHPIRKLKKKHREMMTYATHCMLYAVSREEDEANSLYSHGEHLFIVYFVWITNISTGSLVDNAVT